MTEVRNDRAGFTMIEVLVVVTIIVILTGVLFRGMALLEVNRRKTQCIAEMQSLQNALEEYYAEYGIYPPVKSVGYEHQSSDTNHLSPAFVAALKQHSDPNDTEMTNTASCFFADTDEGRVEGDAGWTSRADWNMHFKYGLVAHLWPRSQFEPKDAHWYNKDTDRDVKAKARWMSHLEGVAVDGGSCPAYDVPSDFGTGKWTNQVSTINDPWGREYHYDCPSPHMRYSLWSDGPNAAITQDDIHADKY